MLCALLQVGILNRDSTSGERLTEIYEEIDQVVLENERLTYQIASASALATIAAQSRLQGFNEQAVTVSVSSIVPIAFAHSTAL